MATPPPSDWSLVCSKTWKPSSFNSPFLTHFVSWIVITLDFKSHIHFCMEGHFDFAPLGLNPIKLIELTRFWAFFLFPLIFFLFFMSFPILWLTFNPFKVLQVLAFFEGAPENPHLIHDCTNNFFHWMNIDLIQKQNTF